MTTREANQRIRAREHEQYVTHAPLAPLVGGSKCKNAGLRSGEDQTVGNDASVFKRRQLASLLPQHSLSAPRRQLAEGMCRQSVATLVIIIIIIIIIIIFINIVLAF